MHDYSKAYQAHLVLALRLYWEERTIFRREVIHLFIFMDLRKGVKERIGRVLHFSIGYQKRRFEGDISEIIIMSSLHF